MSEWRELELGRGLRVKHGWAFKGEHFRDSGEQIVLTPGNFHDGGGFKPKNGTEKFYDGAYPEQFLLKRGDVVTAMTEQAQGLLGSTATIPSDETFLHNQRIGLVEIADPEVLDLRYVYHLMNAPMVRRQLQATATGSKVRHTAPERIQDVRVAVPDIPTQQVIAEVLDTVDALIENNRRRVAVLEEMARAIYREWFVKFRYSGHEDVPLVESALGPIPDGWQVSTLAAIADFTMGQSPKSEFYNDEGIGKPFHQGVADFGRYFPTTRKWCSVEGRSAEDGDVLISVRAPVGRINVADTAITIGRGLAAVRAKDGRQGLLLGHLREAFAVEDSMGNDGAIFKSLGKAEFASIPVVIPPSAVAESGNMILNENFGMIRALSHSMQRLSALRDLLLPKLVTGQIDVSALDLDALLAKRVGS